MHESIINEYLSREKKKVELDVQIPNLCPNSPGIHIFFLLSLSYKEYIRYGVAIIFSCIFYYALLHKYTIPGKILKTTGTRMAMLILHRFFL